MAKDINIHLKTTGGARSKQELDEFGKSSKKVGETVGKGGKRGADGMDKMSSSAGKAQGRFSKLGSSIKSWAAGLVGITAVIAGITSAIRIQSEAMKEHARIASEQQKKLLALQTMGTIYEEHPELRKEIETLAIAGARPIPEVTEAYYTLESKGAGLTKEQKTGIMKEAIELARMEPEAPLKSIVDIFSLYAKETQQQNINQIQNVIRRTLSKAGAELGEMGKLLPRFLPAGIAGGLTGAETLGFWAAITTRAGGPEEATMAARKIFTSLRGRGTPESQELLQQLGATPDKTIFEQLGALSAARKIGKVGIPELQLIAGEEYYSTLASVLTDLPAMMEAVGEITSVARPDIDIVKKKLEKIMSTDELARLEETGRRLEVALEGAKGKDIKAKKIANLIDQWEIVERYKGTSETRIAWGRKFFEMAGGMGLVPYGAEPFPSEIEEAERGGMPPNLFKNIVSSWEEAPILTDKERFGRMMEDVSAFEEKYLTIHYHNDIYFNPMGGTKEDRGIGPRVPPP